jgi:hypothetical protein
MKYIKRGSDKLMKKRDDDEMRAFILITKFQFERDIANGDFEIIDYNTIRVRICHEIDN